MTKSQERGSLQWYIRPNGSLGLGIELAELGQPQKWRCLHSPSDAEGFPWEVDLCGLRKSMGPREP